MGGGAVRESERKELEVGLVTTRITRGFWPILRCREAEISGLGFRGVVCVLETSGEGTVTCWLHDFLGIRESKSLGVTT